MFSQESMIMLFSKRAIYNKALKVIANEIIASDDLSLSNEPLKLKAFSDFLTTLVEKTDRSLKDFTVIVPYELAFFIRDLPKEIKRKVILKINLKISQAERYIDAESLIAEGYKIAVDIQDKRSLRSIPNNAHFIILDSLFMTLISELDKILLDPDKLIIKNIETYDLFRSLTQEGIQFFSGTFIETPKQIAPKVMSSNKITVLKLISTLNDPDVALEEVSKIIS